ncbi:hypothetical protein BLOT_011764 [Blomia tropicalis]|nr:hypothetical protein BLOT_011764 [Blomia tropicalis]
MPFRMLLVVEARFSRRCSGTIKRMLVSFTEVLYYASVLSHKKKKKKKKRKSFKVLAKALACFIIDAFKVEHSLR